MVFSVRFQPPQAATAALGLVLMVALAAQAAEGDPVHPLLGRCDAPPSAACAAELEVKALASGDGTVQRDGDVIKLPDGSSLQDSPQRQFRWLGALGGSGLHLVLERPVDAPAGYRLVGLGAPPLRLDAPPWLAPGERLMISVSDLGPAAPPGGLRLLGRVDARWRVLLYQELPGGMGLQFQSWRGDGAAVRLQWHCVDGSSGAVQLRDGPYGWDFVPPLPSRCGPAGR